MTNKSTTEDAKKKDIIELIRLRMLQPDTLDSILNIWVQQGISVSGKCADLEKVIASVKERVLMDSFIEQFTAPFNEIFSHEEIKQLITCYTADSMKKFSKNQEMLVNSIYEAYRQVIQEVIA